MRALFPPPTMAKKKLKKSRTKKTKMKKRVVRKAKKVVRKVKKLKKMKKAKKAVKRVKKAVKKVKKVVKKVAKKAPKAKKFVKSAKKRAAAVTAPPKPATIPAELIIGKVTHYYDHIGVAVVRLEKQIKIGDLIRLVHGFDEFTQLVTSMQAEHLPIMLAVAGQEVGLKVERPTKEGTVLVRS